MQGLINSSSKNMLVSFESSDDAGVYKISDDSAIVQTVDFITPVVNDPYLYGKIAAANSLSDIFAMGAEVHTALNMVAYDNCNVTKEVLNEILQGGLEKIKEAGGVLLGGHTVEDLEMKYGLSVTGLVHPKKIVRNNTMRPGDKIILTKPLGTGVITTAIKADLAPKNAIDKAVFHMSFLNKTAAEIAVNLGVNAMTDVTGFGLLGHLFEMTRKNIAVQLDGNSIPIIEEAYEMAELGMFPAGSYNNREHFSPNVEYDKKLIPDDKIMLMFDAQTSGGLLISVAGDKAGKLLDKIKQAGIEWAVIIGEVLESDTRRITIF